VRNKAVILTVLFLTMSIGGAIMAQEEDSARAEMAVKVREMVEQHGADSAITFIEDSEDFKQVVGTYNNLMMDLYWKEKSLNAAVPVIDAGIKYCLAKSEELAAEDSVMSTKLKTMAKVFSFNLASFTWPGWAQEGITITEDDLDAGLEAAKLNLQLVEELGADPAQMSNSHWSIGAHYLARNTPEDYQNAISAFEFAQFEAHRVGNKDSELMSTGYIAMARILSGSDAREDFDKAVKALNDLGTEDAKYYAQQLTDVLKIFSEE